MPTSHLVRVFKRRVWGGGGGGGVQVADPASFMWQIGEHLGEIQIRLLRAVDDIKESVRAEATKAWRGLTSVSCRLCDHNTAPAAQAQGVLAALLPTLLDFGISHAQDEVRRMATRQLLKLCEVAGPRISPHVVKLVPVLLESLSVAEDPTLNYLQQNTSNTGISESALEAARVNAMRSSDVTAVLEQCLKMMGEAEVGATLPSIMLLLSRGVGLPTRSGTARFLMQLAQQQPLHVRPHAARLLRTLHTSTLSERSDVARRSYAAAAAQVARGAPLDSVSGLVCDLVNRYVNEAATDDEGRQAIGSLMRELMRGASDAMAKVQTDWLPLAFVGRHEPRTQAEAAALDERGVRHSEDKGRIATLWTEAYDEAGIGPSTLGLHAGEVLAFLGHIVEGTSWALRRAAAYALVELAGACKPPCDRVTCRVDVAVQPLSPSFSWPRVESPSRRRGRHTIVSPPPPPPPACRPPYQVVSARSPFCCPAPCPCR